MKTATALKLVKMINENFADQIKKFKKTIKTLNIDNDKMKIKFKDKSIMTISKDGNCVFENQEALKNL